MHTNRTVHELPTFLHAARLLTRAVYILPGPFADWTFVQEISVTYNPCKLLMASTTLLGVIVFTSLSIEVCYHSVLLSVTWRKINLDLFVTSTFWEIQDLISCERVRSTKRLLINIVENLRMSDWPMGRLTWRCSYIIGKGYPIDKRSSLLNATLAGALIVARRAGA